MEIYIHVGFHKTGTTSLQEYLFSQRKYLKKAGILYPKTGLAGSSHAHLANIIKPTYESGEKERIYSSLSDEISSFPGKTVVISSECFLEGVRIKLLRDLLSAINERVIILFYVRPQHEWVKSLYNEITKDSSRRNTGDIMLMREIRQGKLDYYAVIKEWADIFGNDNINVRPFEKEQMNRGLYYDFLSVLTGGHPEDARIKIPDSSILANVGFDVRCLEFLRRLNLISMPREMHREIVAILGKNTQLIRQVFGPVSESYLSADNSRKLFMKGEMGNALIAEKWLKPKSDRLFIKDMQNIKEQAPVHLSIEVQHWLFDQLPRYIIQHLENMSDRVRNRKNNQPFLNTVPTNEKDRLRRIVYRQRQELNWIYAKK